MTELDTIRESDREEADSQFSAPKSESEEEQGCDLQARLAALEEIKMPEVDPN